MPSTGTSTNSATQTVTEILDQLDTLSAAGTKGTWHTAASGAIDAGDYDTVLGRGPVDCMSHCYGGSSTIEGDNLPADADLIVAAVNALPQLTAALRAAERALQLIDQFGCTNLTHGRCSDGPSRTKTATYTADRWCKGCIANDARAAITAALSPATPQSEPQP